MKFDKRLPIVYPFTAYYYGYMGDLGKHPSLTVNLFSYSDMRVLNIDTMVDLREVRQVSNDTLFVGTIYINRKGNNLPPGHYRILVTAKTPYNNCDILYAPIEIEDRGEPFRISYLNKQHLTEDEFRAYMHNLVDPGIKNGFEVTFGSDSSGLDINAGVAYSDRGTKIVLDHQIPNAVHISPTEEYPRTDIVAIYYDETKQDADGNAVLPEIRLVEGGKVNDYTVPLLPDNYIPLAYVSVKPETTIVNKDSAIISPVRHTVSGRPFFNEPALELGDGERSEFSFNITYVDRSTEVFVDGVRQVVDEDYTEEFHKNGLSLIRFIGEVPQPGQRVTLSGQCINSPYLDYDLSAYTTPSAVDVNNYPLLPDYTSCIYVAYLGCDYSPYENSWRYSYADGPYNLITDTRIRPLKSHSSKLNTFLYFKEEDRLKMQEGDGVPQKNVSIVLWLDMTDSPQATDVRRIFTMDNVYLNVTNTPTKATFDLYINDVKAVSLEVPAGFIKLAPNSLAVNLFDDEVSLRYGTSKVKKIIPSGDVLLSENNSLLALGRPWLEEEESVLGLSYSLSALYLYTRPISAEDARSFKN